MARQVDGPSDAQASNEVAGEENDGDDDDWPTLVELDLKLSILMGRVGSDAARPSETRNAR